MKFYAMKKKEHYTISTVCKELKMAVAAEAPVEWETFLTCLAWGEVKERSLLKVKKEKVLGKRSKLL